MDAQDKLLKFHELTRARHASELASRRRAGGDEGLAGLAADAAARGIAYEGTAGELAEAALVAAAEGGSMTRGTTAGDVNRRAFYKHLKALLEKADILLEVLDARDPLACRSSALEAAALSCNPPKRVVLVLNKIDLVPPEVVTAWLSVLRKDFPTVAFKASTQSQKDHISSRGGGGVNAALEAGTALTGSGAAGADTLVQLIKNYSRSHNLKTAVTVGIVGYPNVGKSSIINSLKRSKAVGVSATPGFTRSLQEVSLDAKVTLIDSPGIIFDDDGGAGGGGLDGASSLLLRNVISVDSIDDPEGAAGSIVDRCAPEKLMVLYGVPAFSTPTDFLSSLAVRLGKLGRGGVPDRASAGRALLQDWNTGRIPFFVLPPEEGGDTADSIARVVAGAGKKGRSVVTTDTTDVGHASIVTGWNKVRKRGGGGRGGRTRRRRTPQHTHKSAPRGTPPPLGAFSVV